MRTSRTILRSIIDLMLPCSFALMLAATIYGIVCYWSAPIRLREDGHYRDKIGREFTEAQFQRFQMWEVCFEISAGLVVISALLRAMSKRWHHPLGDNPPRRG